MNLATKVETKIENRDQALRERAKKVIPGGMWGHMNAARLPPEYPQYFARGQGARLWDVNGREYIDFICGYGPIGRGPGLPSSLPPAASAAAWNPSTARRDFAAREIIVPLPKVAGFLL